MPLLTFVELNEYLTKSSNDRLKIQSMLNLVLFKRDSKTIENILKLLSKSKDHIVFYRFVNYESIDKVFTKEMMKKIFNIISTNEGLPEQQKAELGERLLSRCG